MPRYAGKPLSVTWVHSTNRPSARDQGQRSESRTKPRYFACILFLISNGKNSAWFVFNCFQDFYIAFGKSSAWYGSFGKNFALFVFGCCKQELWCGCNCICICMVWYLYLNFARFVLGSCGQELWCGCICICICMVWYLYSNFAWFVLGSCGQELWCGGRKALCHHGRKFFLLLELPGIATIIDKDKKIKDKDYR